MFIELPHEISIDHRCITTIPSIDKLILISCKELSETALIENDMIRNKGLLIERVTPEIGARFRRFFER